MTMMTRLATASGLALLALSMPALAEGFGECKVTGTAGSVEIPTVAEGTLTVAAILPAPDSFKGNSPETITGGFEYCLVAEIAHRAGLSSVTVQNVSWPALIAGQLSGFDTAMTNIFITEERLKSVDFTAPYFVATSGVMVRSEDAATITKDNLGEKRLGVFLASVQDKYLAETMKPTGEIRRFEATADMFTALSAGQIDAVLFDLSLVLPAATASNGALSRDLMRQSRRLRPMARSTSWLRLGTLRFGVSTRRRSPTGTSNRATGSAQACGPIPPYHRNHKRDRDEQPNGSHDAYP